jgi:hypothetical protein
LIFKSEKVTLFGPLIVCVAVPEKVAEFVPKARLPLLVRFPTTVNGFAKVVEGC